MSRPTAAEAPEVWLALDPFGNPRIASAEIGGAFRVVPAAESEARDAARYRWLEKHGHYEIEIDHSRQEAYHRLHVPFEYCRFGTVEVGPAIDAAMAEKEQTR